MDILTSVPVFRPDRQLPQKVFVLGLMKKCYFHRYPKFCVWLQFALSSDRAPTANYHERLGNCTPIANRQIVGEKSLPSDWRFWRRRAVRLSPGKSS